MANHSNTKQEVSKLMRLAQRAFPDRVVRIQPVPNTLGTNVYQLHTRPERCEGLHDFDWKLVEQGELELMICSLKHKQSNYNA